MIIIKKLSKLSFFLLIFLFLNSNISHAQDTRLLRQPDINATHIVFSYGGDIWVNSFAASEAKRITSTPAVESNPHLSPDGKWIAFSSNRSGSNAVYIVSINGGDVKRLTWHPN